MYHAQIQPVFVHTGDFVQYSQPNIIFEILCMLCECASSISTTHVFGLLYQAGVDFRCNFLPNVCYHENHFMMDEAISIELLIQQLVPRIHRQIFQDSCYLFKIMVTDKTEETVAEDFF